MQRVKIEMPEAFIFQTELKIRITDLNYGGHVGNDVFLSLMHEARFQFLRKYQYTELDFEGLGLIMGDCAVVFRSEVFYGQDLLVKVTPYNFSKVGFDLCYYFSDKATGKEVLRAKTGLVCFNYTSRKVAELPGVVLNKWN